MAAAVVAGVIVVSATACSPGAVRSALSNGVDLAQAGASAYVDELSGLASVSTIRIPPQLDDAVKQADDLLRSGGQLADEERALLAVGEQWVAFYKGFNAALAAADELGFTLPDDAIRIVNASLLRDPGPEFRAAMQQMEERLLKSMTCQAARDGLDAVGEEQAQAMTPNYEPMTLSRDAVERFIERELNLWQGALDYIDAAALVSTTIETHNDRIDGIFEVLESPTGSLRTANIIWFRHCVLR